MTAKEFRHKADEGRDLASLKQLVGTVDRDAMAPTSKGAEQRLCLNHVPLLRQEQEAGWASRAQLKPHSNFLLLW